MSARRIDALTSRHGGTLLFACLCLAVALGLGLRVGTAIDGTYEGPDARAYNYIAKSLYINGSFDDDGLGERGIKGAAEWSPGTPLLYAGVYYLTGGANPLIGRLLVALLGGLSVLIVYLIARRCTEWLPGRRAGPAASVTAAFATAAYPGLFHFFGTTLSEPLAEFLLPATVLSFLWASDADRERVRRYALPGLLLGITTLTRPEYLTIGLLFIVIALVRVARRRKFRAGLAAAGLVAVTFLVPVALWSWHNYNVLGRFVPVTAGGGKVLFIGTYLPGKGMNDSTKRELLRLYPDLRLKRYRGLPYYSRRELSVTDMDPLLDRVVRKYPALERDQALGKIGRENMVRFSKRHPLQYLHMLMVKAWFVWMWGALWATDMLLLALHRVLIVPAFLGLGLIAWKSRWQALVLLTPIVGLTFVMMLFQAAPRRALPSLPLVFIGTGVALVWLYLQVKKLIDRRTGSARDTIGANDTA